MQTPPHYVLTGGPCAGKTTTIAELERRGYLILPEAARLIIDERLAAGETIDQIRNGPGWNQSIVRRQFAMEKEVSPEKIYFFDRAFPDNVAYYRSMGLEMDEEFKRLLAGVSYRKIFLLELVDFVNDEARTETPEQAMMLHGLIREAYKEQGFDIVEVPIMPVPERVDLILANL